MTFPEFEDFQKDYPNLFREYPRCGFSLPNGWVTLVRTLSSVLEFHIERLPEETRKHIYCAQTKQKFGMLRFYMTAQDDFISGAISAAESMSAHICEICGNPGSLRNDDWTQTLCDKDAGVFDSNDDSVFEDKSDFHYE